MWVVYGTAGGRGGFVWTKRTAEPLTPAQHSATDEVTRLPANLGSQLRTACLARRFALRLCWLLISAITPLAFFAAIAVDLEPEPEQLRQLRTVARQAALRTVYQALVQLTE